ncbi:MAG: PAS domain-containing protein [Arcobacteraceae bacterium]
MEKRKIDIKHIDTYIELITDCVFIKDIDGKYIYCNNVYLKFLDKTKEEVIGKTDYDFLPKENADKCFKDDQDVLNGDLAIDFEDTFIFKEHENLYFQTTKQKIFDLDENFIGVFSISRDITQIKQYQLLYEDNNELLEYMNYETNTKKILEKIVNLSEKRNKNIKCSILLLDETKTHLRSGVAPNLPSFYNDAINGVEIGEKVGSCGSAAFCKKRIIVENINTHPNWQPYLKLTQKANLHSCWSEPIFSSNNEVLGTFAMYSNKPTTPSDFQLKLITSYAHLAAVTIEKENKKIEADIKTRKLLEQELESRNKDLELFKQVIKNINYGVSIATADGTNKLIYVNEEFTNITGYSKKEVLNRNCKFLQNNDYQPKELAIITDGLKTRKKIQVEIRNYKKDGTLFYNHLNIAPVYDKEGVLTHFVGIQKDVTFDKKQEAGIAEQAKLASMGEMIANIAHQWRQPLSVISTAATGMQLQKEFGFLKDEDFDKTCKAINENVQYLSQTIEDFKNFISKDSQKRYFFVSKNIHKFLSLISGTVKNEDINVILNLDDTLEINGYENELIQCFMNIFNNAKDAYTQKSDKLFFIDAYRKNKKVVIRLKDNAGGIPENIITKVFEPYFTTKHKFQGTGLGLHMTYNLIEEGMKGRIKVTNSTYSYNEIQYTGAEFIIILPFA